MTLVCECGAAAVRITDSWELATNAHGDVVKFDEQYQCDVCGRTGTLEHRHGSDHLYGCLEHGGIL